MRYVALLPCDKPTGTAASATAGDAARARPRLEDRVRRVDDAKAAAAASADTVGGGEPEV